MNNWTVLTGLMSSALVIAVAVCFFAMRLALPLRRIMVGIAIVSSLLPLGALSAAAFLRGIAGDLSITTVLLLALTLANRLEIYSYTYAAAEKTRSYAVWVVAALLLYPCALGLGNVDPYRWGFGEVYFLAVLLCVVALAYRWRLWLVAWSVLLATAAWTAGSYESANLWDYLIDPWLSLFVIAALLGRAAKLVRPSR